MVLPDDGTNFYVPVSAENISMLDADLVLYLGAGDGIDVVAEHPIVGTPTAARNEAIVALSTDQRGAITYNSVLSIPFALERWCLVWRALWRETGSATGSAALTAGAENFDRVAHVGEAVGLGDALRPLLDGGPFDLDGEAARPAHQVMVMAGGTTPIDRLAVVGAEYVDGPGVGEGLEGSIDGGQPDALAAFTQLVV